MSRLLVPFADQHVEIPSMTAGNIALTVGLKQVECHTSPVLSATLSVFFNYVRLCKFSFFLEDSHWGHNRFIEGFSSSRSPASSL